MILSAAIFKLYRTGYFYYYLLAMVRGAGGRSGTNHSRLKRLTPPGSKTYSIKTPINGFNRITMDDGMLTPACARGLFYRTRRS